MEDVIRIDRVEQYNDLFGLETPHPLVSVVDLSQATKSPTRFTLSYGVYAVFLKQVKCGDIRYGRNTYDYQEGTVVCFAPGQVAQMDMPPGTRHHFPPRPHPGHIAREGHQAIFLLLLPIQRGLAPV